MVEVLQLCFQLQLGFRNRSLMFLSVTILADIVNGYNFLSR